MSMSTRVIGFKPPNEKWQQMAAIYNSCMTAEVDLPEEVERFFGGEPPDPNGVMITEGELRDKAGCVTPWEDDMADGVEVDVTKLPKDVTVLRFYNSW